MHNGSVLSLLQRKGGNLDWNMRMKFAINAAAGVYVVFLLLQF
jgi:hypothetical protein